MVSRRAFLSAAGAAATLGLLPSRIGAAPLGKVRDTGVLRVAV